MNQSYTLKPSVGKIVFCCIVGLVMGILQPVLLMLQLMMPMMIPCFSAMVAVALYAAAGWIPTAVFGVSLLAGSVVGLGGAGGLASLPICVVPAAVMILGVRARQPFFRQIARAIVSAIAGVLLSVGAAALSFGMDMIGQMMAQVQGVFEEMMPALWEVQEAVFTANNISITYDEYATMYFNAIKVLEEYYGLYLPANLLTGAVVTGVVGTLWGNWLTARRGEATTESFVGLSEWYLPANMTTGMLMTLVAGLILSRTGINGAQTTWIAVSSLAQLAFAVQGFATFDRRNRERGATGGQRVRRIILMLVLCLFTAGGGLFSISLLMAVAGAASALFGRKGAFRLWAEKQKKDMDGEDR